MKVNHLSFSYNHQSYMKDINIQFKDQKITRKIEIPKIPFIILIISILGMCILNKKMKV